MKILYGLCINGPKDGQTMAESERRVKLPGGFYVYVAAIGPTPALWKWIEEKTK